MDFTPMYAAHDAFRRDLDRLITAAQTGLGADPTVRAGWKTFREQLDIHHRAEDTALWPPALRAGPPYRPEVEAGNRTRTPARSAPGPGSGTTLSRTLTPESSDRAKIKRGPRT